MLRLTLSFFVLAVAAALFGFGGVASGFASVAQVLLFLLCAVVVVSLLVGLFTGLRGPATSALLVTLAITGFGCGGSDSNDDLKESYREAAKETKEWTQESWAAFVEGSKEKYAALEEKMAKLKEQAAEKSGEVGEDLENQMQKAKEKLAELKDATADGWEKTKRETEAVFEALERKLTEAWDSMSKDG